MTQPTREEAFDALLREAAAWRLRQALAALPSEECLRAEYGPLHRLDRRVRRSVRALQKAQQRRVLNRTSRRKMRRILLAAALLAALAAGTLAVSAELRLLVKDTLVEWMERNMSIRYEVEGHPLTALPEGYAPHYIPEGFVYTEEISFTEQNQILLDYENEAGYFVQIAIRIAENGSIVVTDSEHITYKTIDFGEADAYFGTFDDGDGYVMYWFEDGMEHELYINAILPESEVFQIADNIY